MAVIVVNLSISARYRKMKLLQAQIRKDFMQIYLYVHANIVNLCILRCKLDAAADVNVIPVSVYKKLFCDYNLTKLGPIHLL